MSPDLEERFQTGVRATEESKALEDAMNFGDIEVGFKQDSGEGCAIMLVVLAVLFVLFLLNMLRPQLTLKLIRQISGTWKDMLWRICLSLR